MRGLDGKNVQGDRRGEQEGQRVVADRQGEHDRGPHQPAVGPSSRPVAALRTPAHLPADEQADEDRDEREVQCMRLGVGADRPGKRRDGEPKPDEESDPARAGQDPHEVHGHANGQGRRRSPRRGSCAMRHPRTAAGRSRRASRGSRTSGSRSGARCRGRARRPAARPCPRMRRPAGGASPSSRNAVSAARTGGPQRSSRRRVTIRAGCPRPRPTH